MADNCIRYSTLIPHLALSAVLLFSGCAKKNEYKAPPPVDVTVAKPVHGQMEDSIETDGLVAATQLVEIRAQVEGQITKIHFQDGQEVEEGKLLFEIDPRQYNAAQSQAQANVVDLQAQLAFSRSDYQRSRDLYAEESISKQEYEQARQKMRALQAQVQAAQASKTGTAVQVDFTKVRAPISGRISRRLVDRGQLVGSGEPTLLATIVASKDTYVEFSLSESDLSRAQQYFAIHEGSRERFRSNKVIRIGLRGEEGFPHEGRIDSIENMLDASTGTLDGRGIFVDSDRSLFPGLYCRVEIPLGTSVGLAVPEKALMLDQVGRYVFVVDKDKRVQRRPVVLGGRKGALRRIEEGLGADERVVIRGLARVRVGSYVTPQEKPIDASFGAANQGAQKAERADVNPGAAKPVDPKSATSKPAGSKPEASTPESNKVAPRPASHQMDAPSAEEKAP